MSLKRTLSILGPGLLYAAAAIGVSHLVQSTRAGAMYGFDLIPFLFIAMVIKYPFFEFAPRYTNATGRDLLDAYREMGNWAVALYAVITIFTMFAITAAVLLVTTGIFSFVFNIHLDTLYVGTIILIICAVVLMIGRYSLLDKTIKYVVAILAVSTIVAVASASGVKTGYSEFMSNFDFLKRADIFFLIAFIGWMPSPIDVSVWHSLWSKAKGTTSKSKISMKDGLLDFKIGYIGTGFVALAFLSLGALIMYGSNETFSPKGVVFSGQLINMYTSAIGSWAYPVIAIAAVTTMFSTTLTVVDAYPRVLAPITKHYFKKQELNQKSLYWIWMVVIVLGTLLLISTFSSSMQFMVDLATKLSFITAPVVAILNYKAVTRKGFPEANKPGNGLLWYARIGIVFLVLFSLFYIVYLFV